MYLLDEIQQQKRHLVALVGGDVLPLGSGAQHLGVLILRWRFCSVPHRGPLWRNQWIYGTKQITRIRIISILTSQDLVTSPFRDQIIQRANSLYLYFFADWIAQILYASSSSEQTNRFVPCESGRDLDGVYSMLICCVVVVRMFFISSVHTKSITVSPLLFSTSNSFFPKTTIMFVVRSYSKLEGWNHSNINATIVLEWNSPCSCFSSVTTTTQL